MKKNKNSLMLGWQKSKVWERKEWEAMEERKRKKTFRWRKWVPIFIMMSPGLIYLLVNNYLPMFGLVIAFKKVNFQLGIWESPWAGFSNFTYLFKTPEALTITRNTLLYNAAFITVNTGLSLSFALFITEMKSKFCKKIYQSAVLLPYLMSAVIVSYIVYALLSPDKGMVNNSILKPLGKKPVSWYMEPKYWPFILLLVNAWKGVGYNCLVFIAGLSGISPGFYEAARLDGASKWQEIFYISLPCMKTSIITLVLLQIGRIFYSDFGLFYQVPMNSGALFDVTNTIDTYVYRSLLQLGNIGMASAAGFYQSIVGFGLILVCNALVRGMDKDSALF